MFEKIYKSADFGQNQDIRQICLRKNSNLNMPKKLFENQCGF